MPIEYKVQVVLLAAFAVVFVALTVWCLQRTGAGRWAVLGAAGAGLLALSFGLESAAQVESTFLDSFHIAEEVLFRGHVYTALIAVKVLGAVLLGWAFVETRRTPQPTSLYRSPVA